MLAALDVRSVAVGLATGGLSATVVGLGVGSGLALLGVPAGPDVGLLIGVLTGMASAGWVSGRLSPHSHRFHGSVSGLLFAGMLVLIAGAASAGFTVGNVLLLAAVGVVVGGFAGWLGGRRRGRAHVK